MARSISSRGTMLVGCVLGLPFQTFLPRRTGRSTPTSASSGHARDFLLAGHVNLVGDRVDVGARIKRERERGWGFANRSLVSVWCSWARRHASTNVVDDCGSTIDVTVRVLNLATRGCFVGDWRLCAVDNPLENDDVIIIVFENMSAKRQSGVYSSGCRERKFTDLVRCAR